MMKMTDDMDEKEEVEWYRSQLRAQQVLRAAKVNLGVQHTKEWTHKKMISHLRDQLVSFIAPSGLGLGSGSGEKKEEEKKKGGGRKPKQQQGVDGVPLDPPPVAAEEVNVEENESKDEEDDDDEKVLNDLGDSKRGGHDGQQRASSTPAVGITTRGSKRAAAATPQSTDQYRKTYETSKRAKKRS